MPTVLTTTPGSAHVISWTPCPVAPNGVSHSPPTAPTRFKSGSRPLPTPQRGRRTMLPILASGAELGGLWALPAIRLRDADCRDQGIHKREHDITRRHFAHRLIKRIARAVSVPLRRPDVPSGRFLPVGLVLIDPPVPH